MGHVGVFTSSRCLQNLVRQRVPLALYYYVCLERRRCSSDWIFNWPIKCQYSNGNGWLISRSSTISLFVVTAHANGHWIIQWRIQGGGQGGQDPPWDSREEVPAHGKIAFICWRIVSKFVWLDLSPKDDQNRGEDTNISKIFLGENPPKQPITIQWIS